jgi:hypothetical protein
MNIGHERGFRFKPSCISNKMPKLSTLSVHAGIAADRFLGPYFLPSGPSGTVDHSFHWNVLPELLQEVDPFLVHTLWCSTTFSACIATILEQRVSGKICRTRWTNSMACAFPWFILLYLKTFDSTVSGTAVIDVQKVKQWSRMDLRWFVGHLEFSSESGNHCSEVQHPALMLKVAILSIFSKSQVTVNLKLCFWRPLFMWHLLLILCCRSTSCRCGRRFFLHLV